jgi:hypothetical protein
LPFVNRYAGISVQDLGPRKPKATLSKGVWRMQKKGLFAMDSIIAVPVPALPRLSWDHMKNGRPWIRSIQDGSPVVSGTLRIVRIIGPNEESIDESEYFDRLCEAHRQGIATCGWQHAEWLMKKINSGELELGMLERLRILIFKEVVDIDFPGTTFYRDNGCVGMPTLIPDHGLVDMHCSGMNFAFRRRVAIFVPAGVMVPGKF